MAESNNTPARQSSHKRTTNVRRRPAPPSQEQKIEFPAEDQRWLALQHRVIELATKPVEDLSYRELQEVRLDLSDAELLTLNEYLRGRRLESSNAFDGIVRSRNWTEKLCGQTLEDLIDFQDCLRAVVLKLDSLWLRQSNELEAIERDLINFLDKFPGAEIKPPGGEAWKNYNGVLANIGRVPPTDEGIEFMWGLYDQLQSRKDEERKQEEDKRLKKAAELKRIQESGKHVFKIEVVHVRAHTGGRYDIIAPTEKKASQEAIRRFDADYPNARQNNWPIRVRVVYVDDTPTHDYSETSVPWDSELVKSIQWGASTPKEAPAN